MSKAAQLRYDRELERERARRDRKGILLVIAIGIALTLFNWATTGDWDGHSGERCISNARTNEVECWPDENQRFAIEPGA